MVLYVCRRLLVPTFFMVIFSASVLAVSEVEEKYNKSCGFCHALGTAGAPKSHDATAWKPRIAKGIDVLRASVKNGLNAMPPKGLCTDCSDEMYENLIVFMSTTK